MILMAEPQQTKIMAPPHKCADDDNYNFMTSPTTRHGRKRNVATLPTSVSSSVSSVERNQGSGSILPAGKSMKTVGESFHDKDNGCSKRRWPTTSQYIRGLTLVAAFLVLRTLHTSFVYTYNWKASEDRNLDSPFLELPSNFRGSERRSRRKRPRSSIAIDPVASSIYPLPTNHILSSNELNLADEGAWKRLCGGKDQYSIVPSSRVLISGIVSHPLGSEIALTLTKKCGVENMVGIADHPLNTDAFSRLAFLLRHLPNLQIHTSEFGINEVEMSEIFASLKPTLVIYLEAAPSPMPLERMPPPFQLRKTINTLELLCNSIVKQKYRDSQEAQLVHVTSGDQNELLSMAASHVYPMLLHTYRVQYDLRILQLKLPHIYGPFREGALWITDGFLQGNTTNLTNVDGNVPLIHISDSVQAVLSGMALSEASTARMKLLVIPDSHTINLNQLLKNIQESRNISADKLAYLVSWYHKNVYPYADTSVHEDKFTARLIRKAIGTTNKRLSLNESDGISLLQRRQNGTFPCLCECAAHIPCKKTSVLTPLLPISRSVTTGCRFVVYMVNFSRRLDELPLLSEAQEYRFSWPGDQICQVAFVSSKSKLVKRLAEIKKRQQPKAKLQTEDLNGELVENRWRLVWLEQDDSESLSEADYMMLKIVPGTFFSSNVTKAFYIEPDHLHSLPALNVLWFLMAKGLDTKKRKAKGKTIPARHNALLTYSFNVPEDNVANMDALARFVLGLKNQGSERIWPRRQLRFYELALESMDYRPIDTLFLIHNLESDRSRRLRCEWYEEQLFWSDDDKRNRDLEDLSLSFVMARWRFENRLVPFDDEKWGERIVDPSKGDSVEIRDQGSSQSQYFIKLHRPMEVRRHYN